MVGDIIFVYYLVVIALLAGMFHIFGLRLAMLLVVCYVILIWVLMDLLLLLVLFVLCVSGLLFCCFCLLELCLFTDISWSWFNSRFLGGFILMLLLVGFDG